MDKQLRREERKLLSNGGDIAGKASLLYIKLKSGQTTLDRIQDAAAFNDPVALQFLGEGRATLKEFLRYMKKQNKRFAIEVCIIVCRDVYPIYHNFMWGSSESSEQRAIGVVNESDRDHVSCLVEAPLSAISSLENYLSDSSTRPGLEVQCHMLGQITEVVSDTIVGAQTEQIKLWDPSKAGLLALNSILRATCAGSGKKRSKWASNVAKCIKDAVNAVASQSGCSQDTAFDRITGEINVGLFGDLI